MFEPEELINQMKFKLIRRMRLLNRVKDAIDSGCNYIDVGILHGTTKRDAQETIEDLAWIEEEFSADILQADYSPKILAGCYRVVFS